MKLKSIGVISVAILVVTVAIGVYTVVRDQKPKKVDAPAPADEEPTV